MNASTGTAQGTRPLIVQVGSVRISVQVSSRHEDWVAAEILREEFLHTAASEAAQESVFETTHAAQVDLHARLLAFLADKLSNVSNVAILLAVFQSFTTNYLQTIDVHTLAASLDVQTQKIVLASYYKARSALEARHAEVPHPPASALLIAAKEGKASIYALFGGQGTNEVYFDELQYLYDVYQSLIEPMVAALTASLNEYLKTAPPTTAPYYTHGLDVAGWLSGSIPRPPIAYLASIPVSFPLIGLTQLLQYYVACRVANLTPGEMRSLVKGATGHSQGIVSAVCIASSTSFESFMQNVTKSIKWLFFCGLRGQETFPVLAIEPSIVKDAVEGGEGTPSPMLAVTGLPLSVLEKHIRTTNKHLPSNSQLYVSLHNGPKAFVITGPARALFGLVTALRQIRAPSGLDQTRVPFSQRKPTFSIRYLTVGVPYHSEYLAGATRKVFDTDLDGQELWTADDLAIPVYHTETGSDLGTWETSLTQLLCDQIFTLPIHWTKATAVPDDATHAIDFGPGALSGIGGLTARNWEGRGIRTIVIGDKGKGDLELYRASHVQYDDWWRKKFSPKLVRTADGKLQLDTPFSRLLGKSPLMVAGMTPSTVKGGFVSAVLSAGYHIELAGGGHYNATALRAKVAEIQANVPAGTGLTLNALYINPRQFNFQFPLWLEMKREGIPIEGFCVAAGIPSIEKAGEIIDGLRSAGIRHVSFKPGSVDGIRQVVNIAAAHPDFPIILQWTGGRAGGHHSCEDFHQPMLSTYASIRQHANIILVGGSGFGGSEDVLPYLTGDWSINEPYNSQPMPFDGFLFASRVMVAKEAHTSRSVKELIVAAAGVSDSQWEGTYAKETGGILTVTSELGEPIHKIATRGVKLWKELDDTVFALPKEKRAAWLKEKHDYIVKRLNADFQKPWFCSRKDGTVVREVGDMTYEDVARRLVRLMFVAHEGRWIDITLRNLVGDWLRRAEERFAGIDHTDYKTSEIQSYSELDDPLPYLDKFFSLYSDATKQLVCSEDAAYFLAIAQRPGQKPVPFIPVLDADFGVWFKKDSLWQSEDIEAVFDQDPQRVCILQGPVAVKHANVVDEPIANIFGNIDSALVKKILDRFYDGNASNVPEVDYVGAQSSREATFPAGVERELTAGVTKYKIGSTVPPVNDWLEVLASQSFGWLRAFLTTPNIVQGSSYVANPIRRLFAPRANQEVVITSLEGSPVKIELFGANRPIDTPSSSFRAVEACYDATARRISLTIFEERTGASVPLHLVYNYRPDQGFAPVHEVLDSRNKSIKQFYWKLWFGDSEELPELNVREVFTSPEVTIGAQEIETFCAIIGNDGEAFKRSRNSTMQAPMDFSIVTGWKAIMQAIFPTTIDGDLLRLVHLTNGFRLLNGARPLQLGDTCQAKARIVSVVNSDSGKTVKVKGYIIRDGQHVMEVTSSFLYRGRFTDYVNSFEVVDEDMYEVEYATDAAVGVLQSKEWFEWESTSPLLAGTTLIFKLQSELHYKDKTTFASAAVKGEIFVRDQLKVLIRVGNVNYEKEPCQGNPVMAYLQRHGQALGRPVMFEASGYTIRSADKYIAPRTNLPYSTISGDFNPIHVNPYFSDFAQLPGTITHGMYSSAATRKFLETALAAGVPERVVSYDVAFVGMVLPGDELNVAIRHVGMSDGNMVVKVETSNERGEKVLEGTAEIAQPTTAYVFTGQGSQEPGMGMELYANSPAARAVWDAADKHLIATYGFSIVDIVKNNPLQKTVHFGGIKGQEIRQRYMAMSYDTLDKDGIVKTLPLFSDIDIRTPRYSFSHPSGLLFATQFAQIALVVTEKAAFEDMSAKGFVQKDCPFAGHSLGEYSALASIADVLPISALVDVVFYRGITMQRAVERDEAGRSNYAMCAVNPSRISKTFNDAALREVVDAVTQRSDRLLEIVNFNVEGQQYVCAGELVALQALTNVLNYLKIEKVDIAKLTEKLSLEKVREMLGEIVANCIEKALKQQQEQGFIKLERGFATIPLPGIDVPFHSRYLWAGVMPFRTYLSKKINPAQLNPDMLVGKYVPNLVAKPFEVSKDYAQMIYDQTSSPRLDKVLRNWEEENWASDAQRQKLAYIILVELLAYQFASPVRWIETQDRLFTQYKFERLIELGPGPTLTGMATRTLKAKYEVSDNSVALKRTILCHAKNTKEIYYQFEDEAAPEAPAAEAPAAAPTAAPVAASAPVAAAAPSVAVAAVPDEPLKALDTLRVIISQKLKKRVDEIPTAKAIKDLVGGKSTLQNEILGDLQLEFATAPEKGEELPLEELASALNIGYTGQLGKYTNSLISRLVGSKMPGGFGMSSIKSYLSKAWGLGPQRADAAVLHGTTMEPPKRLGSEQEAQAWLDSVAAAYAKHVGISLASGGSGGSSAAGGGSSGAVINSEEFTKFKKEQDDFATQHVELYMRYLKRDSRSGDRAADQARADALLLQARLDSIAKEHGDSYIDGIQPSFDALKVRHFDSSWNWVRQDSLLMFYDIIFGRLTTVDRDITARCIAIMNRADPVLLQYMQYNIDNCDASRGPTYALAKEFGQQLIDNCKEAMVSAPKYKDVTFPTAPKTEVTARGDIVYSEVNREGVRKLEAYVDEMASGDTSPNVNLQKVHEDVLRLWNVVKSQPEISQEQKNRIKGLYEGVVRSLRKTPDQQRPRHIARTRRSSSQFLRPQLQGLAALSADKIPLLHLKRRTGTTWEYSSNLTSVYLDILTEIATSGTTFEGKNALLTGVGKGSIGVEVLKGLLSGGAHVVITTSRFNRANVEFYQDIYQKYGSRGSALKVLPFNQASKQDVEAVVDYIYETLGLDLDYILPFAAIPENGREIDGLDDKSELAHRMMLTNVLRLLGAVKTKKATRHIVTRPTQVILPLSPNHGLFGNDGLYSESKISLETLFNRWASESWGEYLCLAGAVIGWCRGTGLMGATNMVAEQVEAHGVRTFSSKEMAFNLLGLMHPLLFSITQVEPIWADLSGGMDRVPDLAEMTTRIRKTITQQSDLRRAIAKDNAADFKIENGGDVERIMQIVTVTPRANFKFDFPAIETTESLQDLSKLQGLLDLDRVIVITGFAEVGPWGGSRTRWEMEARGEFTIEGCIEMAWLMGYIKYIDGRLKNGNLYVGWVDAGTQEPVDDKDIKSKYEKDILSHAGIRLIEPELHKGYDPKKKVFQQEIQLNHDLEPIEIAESEAQKFRREHGDKADIWRTESGEWFVKLKKGARIIVPKSFKFDRLVAGQIPTGWSAGRFGIPEDIAAQTDRTALWALAATAEALTVSGITDPYELYKHIHPSEVGNCLGSGMGGMQSLAAMFKDRREEKDVQKDVLQETFINTVAGWVNLLLMSSSGPIKIPVGACATALQSVEIACDTILSGKAKVMIAGGFDDFSEEGSFEFANMKATSNAETELAMGREPTEMSRPLTSTRAGFMESQGTGVHVVMSAATALRIGAPIRGVGQAGRSVPAPGRGPLSVARQVPNPHPSPILDIGYRARQMAFRRKQISQWMSNERELLNEEVQLRQQHGAPAPEDFVAARTAAIEQEAVRQEKDALATYGMLEGSDPTIAPLRRALAVWGLTPDDIGVVSIHGTSTKANEANETHIYNDIFKHLNRTPGNAVPVIAQKSLTGHPKGGAAAWMMNGLCQSIITGVIPGNKNADNIDLKLRQYEYLMYPSKTIRTDGIRCGLLTSFGFGQVGGVALVLHPRYLLGAISAEQLCEYKKLNETRALASYKAMCEMMVKNSLVKVKEHPPYTEDLEGPVLLNPLARTAPSKSGEHLFPAKLSTKYTPDTRNAEVLAKSLTASSNAASSNVGVGVDQELISSVPSHNPTFVARNFTEAEIAYCSGQPHPAASFAARWVAKEAVFKSLGVPSKGAAAAMKDIEVIPDASGAPQVVLHGEAKSAAASRGVTKVLVSLSHTDSTAIAFAQASS
ncbi:fatty acid synthase [Auriculariales sp. MPI-PUGE-AT-0066]|nr:fatty acid synthase [Auriculariales sp. MPI-PUGE-AT-0066]